jgi:hypothetical protein
MGHPRELKQTKKHTKCMGDPRKLNQTKQNKKCMVQFNSRTHLDLFFFFFFFAASEDIHFKGNC